MKLIDKDILAKEINKRIKGYQKSLNSFDAKERADIAFQFMEIKETRIDELSEILDFINTLGVKDVNLEKEINDYISNNFFGSQTVGFFSKRTKEEPNDKDIALCAEHFFELGLNANKGK